MLAINGAHLKIQIAIAERQSSDICHCVQNFAHTNAVNEIERMQPSLNLVLEARECRVFVIIPTLSPELLFVSMLFQ